MTSAFINGKNSILSDWKILRKTLTCDKLDIDHLKTVVDFWKAAPIGPTCIDWDEPKEWPDPWRLIYNGEFDESSIAIGMFYTLLLANDQRWDASRLELMLVNDRKRKIQRLVLAIDQQLVLNLYYGDLVPMDVDFQSWIQQRYTYDGKIHSIKNNQQEFKETKKVI